MTSKSKMLVARLGWVVLALAVVNSACMLTFRMGKEEGVENLLGAMQKHELQIMPRSVDGTQIVLIRQIMPDNEIKERVRVDVSATEGAEVRRISESGWGRLGYYEVVTLWQISNGTDREIDITESAFTNLPEGYSLKSDYYDDSVIRLKPRS